MFRGDATFKPSIENGLKISMIIPVLNEIDMIEATLSRLQPSRACGHEVIVVDGGSTDDTDRVAMPLADKVIKIEAGRALQMNAGARASEGNILWFLHADTLVQTSTYQVLIDSLVESTARWGRFDIRLSGNGSLFYLVAWSINLRSRLTGIATGDQGIFVRSDVFSRSCGYEDIPLMEDIELSRRLKKTEGRPLNLTHKLVTSSRRWESGGPLRVIGLMWALRLAYALGVSPTKLAKRYQ